MPRICKAVIDNDHCKESVSDCGLCPLHYSQERQPYRFYKYCEQEGQSIRYSNEHLDKKSISEKYELYTLACVSRALHGRWYYPDQMDWGHETAALLIHDERRELLSNIFLHGCAVVHDKVDKATYDLLKAAVSAVTDSSEQIDFNQAINDAPMIKIVPIGTEGSTYRDPQRPPTPPLCIEWTSLALGDRFDPPLPTEQTQSPEPAGAWNRIAEAIYEPLNLCKLRGDACRNQIADAVSGHLNLCDRMQTEIKREILWYDPREQASKSRAWVVHDCRPVNSASIKPQYPAGFECRPETEKC
ncbi:hypothetical protein F4778DRAFT_797841 [Xylariomycetidae sp. FL2044]|nr:hypothetical protein F4778DRAFT_797841 [Xylariomycetidae sp. FL2044]